MAPQVTQLEEKRKALQRQRDKVYAHRKKAEDAWLVFQEMIVDFHEDDHVSQPMLADWWGVTKARVYQVIEKIRAERKTKSESPPESESESVRGLDESAVVPEGEGAIALAE